jgi:hypothetical protein
MKRARSRDECSEPATIGRFWADPGIGRWLSPGRLSRPLIPSDQSATNFAVMHNAVLAPRRYGRFGPSI